MERKTAAMGPPFSLSPRSSHFEPAVMTSVSVSQRSGWSRSSQPFCRGGNSSNLSSQEWTLAWAAYLYGQVGLRLNCGASVLSVLTLTILWWSL